MADELNTEGLLRLLATEFRTAIEAVGGQPLHDGAATPGAGGGWAIPIAARGTAEGTVTLWIDRGGVRGISRLMMGLDEDPESSVAADMLRELWHQAAAAVTTGGDLPGLTLTPGTPSQTDAPSGRPYLTMLQGTTVLLTLHASGAIESKERPSTRGDVAPRGTTATSTGGSTAGLPGNLSQLLDIDLPLVARFARTEMSLRALTQLSPGSLVDMGRSPDAPVQLLVGTHVVAEGEVVVVNGNYGVRITHLVSPADRLRAMEL